MSSPFVLQGAAPRGTSTFGPCAANCVSGTDIRPSLSHATPIPPNFRATPSGPSLAPFSRPPLIEVFHGGCSPRHAQGLCTGEAWHIHTFRQRGLGIGLASQPIRPHCVSLAPKPAMKGSNYSPRCLVTQTLKLLPLLGSIKARPDRPTSGLVEPSSGPAWPNTVCVRPGCGGLSRVHQRSEVRRWVDRNTGRNSDQRDATLGVYTCEHCDTFLAAYQQRLARHLTMMWSCLPPEITAGYGDIARNHPTLDD